MEGIRALGYLALFQVTRCKSGTNSSRYSSNGYVHPKKIVRLSGRHREQARSYKGFGYSSQRQVVCQDAIASRLAPTVGARYSRQ